MMIVFAAFMVLVGLTLSRGETRRRALARTAEEWALDASGLLAQGVAIPALQSLLVYGALAHLAPGAKGCLALPPAAAFLLNFVLIDYLYYWNHRGLHARRLWPAHAVHHTAERMDVFITSRNTLWTPLLIVYVWGNGLCLFLLRDPAPFLLAAALTAALDLWRHTTFAPAAGSWLHRMLRGWLITPHEHAWHHSRERVDCNFGANLALWDRLHGTYVAAAMPAAAFGQPLPRGLKRNLLFPFGR